MYQLHIHKDAEKAFKKAPKRIREKAFICLKHFRDNGVKDCPYSIDTLKGKFKKFKYLEAKIGKDYRIVFRINEQDIYIRYAGTHNALGTG
ncbi:hypothetical protein COW94_04355 [Candidatus Peregrinibacteria bacterium CG22_combo_CG10-13_8_21_14_all_44_10]|nr:MAG: hypothetical protein AUK45_01135 [Candidatus Peregrinibacteria bacterium CG2_30_44_17]PIP65936.1 MAG: hypothetical protein COW94_04355 [Candidatus Peregrinibacteria bacterium CG22_combo_CG10-13_8_21_14_all_44_10]PIS04152.1 MAG: hypothetical protein COT83_02080 [Candidatus Peregrinibacteria bacterium CG10_big_fil_rev_8_21_14_0_10_44_7]PIX78969.1 MAG: hypothetical protein COZ35_04335 [Candidatus Peregrinibacteria bacterium CG_4_10_14_3_um_filter_44_21]PJB89253.1 MAG: hypothetical protein 